MSVDTTTQEYHPVKDEVYFFNLVTFKVENSLFRVPKHKFQECSHVFRDMFTLPASDRDEELEGISDDKPIFLAGVREVTFRRLLALLYPLGFETDIEPHPSLEECISLLDLSRMWGFDQIRDEAISTIKFFWWNSLPAIEKVELADKYGITEWRRSAYTELAMRDQPLSIDEAYRCGLEFAVKMAHVREKRLAQSSKKRDGSIFIRVENAVMELFGV